MHQNPPERSPARSRLAGLARVLAALAVGFVGLASGLAQSDMDDATLVNALQKGGFVVYFRHAATDFSQNEREQKALAAAGQNDIDFTNCELQRNLSEAGREQSATIGEAFKRRNIPVGRVVSSPYCRSRDTARIAFGRYELNNALTGVGPVRAGSTETVKALLSTLPDAGTNTVVTAHQFPLKAILPDVSLDEGEAAIIEPLVTDFRIVRRIQANAWAALPVP